MAAVPQRRLVNPFPSGGLRPHCRGSGCTAGGESLQEAPTEATCLSADWQGRALVSHALADPSFLVWELGKSQSSWEGVFAERQALRVQVLGCGGTGEKRTGFGGGSPARPPAALSDGATNLGATDDPNGGRRKGPELPGAFGC